MLDMELGTRLDLELLLEEESDCEWPDHWRGPGMLGRFHTDTGAQWLVTMVCPCGGSTPLVLKVCDGAHQRIMDAVNSNEQSTFLDCHICSSHLSAGDAYVSSVKFG